MHSGKTLFQSRAPIAPDLVVGDNADASGFEFANGFARATNDARFYDYGITAAGDANANHIEKGAGVRGQGSGTPTPQSYHFINVPTGVYFLMMASIDARTMRPSDCILSALSLSVVS